MRKLKYMVSAIFILLMTYSVVSAQGGSGDLKIGYIYIDEEGNRSISQSSFNYYDGASISVENFHYRFKNGLRIRSSLQNINLDNRNLSFGLGKPGRFGVDINTNRYRRVYDFEGDSQTKRDMTGGNIWFNPSRYLKVYALGSFNSVSGEVSDLFDPVIPGISEAIDYDRSKYGVGARLKYGGRMFQAEYNTISYTDNLDESKNQSRKRVRLFGHFPVPDYEWLTLSGSLEKFETEYDDTGFKLESTTARGSVTSELVRYLSATYVSYFTRAGSDRDFVETDNLAHLIYISYNPPQKFGLTAGYQYDINDDYADVVKADSYYLSGRLKPFEGIELNAVYGIRAEEVDEGARLVGDEDRARFKIQGKYHKPDIGSVKIGVESRSRINDKLDSEADFNRYFVQSNLNSLEYFIVSGGYSYSRGDYDNAGADFEFESQQVNLNINSREYRNLTGGFGLTYFRSKLDLDTESINLLFTGSYRFRGTQRAEITYRVFNFDDFLALDQYYTENIVEINLIKSFSF
jgi:hypothetical protein